MKNIFSFVLMFLISSLSFAQTVEDANLHVSNIDNNVWFEKYDDAKRTIYNVNFMALCEGRNSEYRTNAFVIKLYLYNKERYEATKEVYYIKTYSVDYIKHFGSWEVKNGTVEFCDMDIEPGVYRLGFYIDAENVIPEDNENDNMVLFQGELVIGEKKCSGSTTTSPQTTTTNPTTETADPDQALKDEKAMLENQLVDYTKKITAIDQEISQAGLTPVDLKLKQLEKQELEFRREACKISIDRVTKSLNNTLTSDELQSYTEKEQEFTLKADALKKERASLTTLRNTNNVYKQQANDYPILIQKQKTDLSGMTRLNKMDSINYQIKLLEIEETEFKNESAKLGLERTNCEIENVLSNGAKPHSDAKIKELQDKENEYNQKAKETNSRLQEQLKLKKEAEKDARKEANQEKIDNSKLKMKIQSLKSQIKLKEKALAKEQKKKNQDSEKIAAIQKEIDALKQELSDAEKQLKP